MLKMTICKLTFGVVTPLVSRDWLSDQKNYYATTPNVCNYDYCVKLLAFVKLKAESLNNALTVTTAKLWQLTVHLTSLICLCTMCLFEPIM